MAYNVANVVVGTATLYVAEADEPMPADTVALGGVWGGQWVSPGATEEGVNFTFSRDTQDHNIEEQSIPALVTVNTSQLNVAVTFAEDTLEVMKYAYGGGTITQTAAGVGQVGKSTLTLSDDLDLLAVGFEGRNAQGFWRRVYIPRVVSAGEVETSYRRSENKRMYAATFRAICKPSDVVITDMTAVATG